MRELLNLSGAGAHRGAEAIQVDPDSKATLGIYVHIPFCRHKCPFCDFYTFPIVRGDTIPNYFRALLGEIGRFEEFGWSGDRSVSSVYFGGGTPSLVEADDVASILKKIRSVFSVRSGAEVTLEINPEDVTPEKARAWRSLGINRASLGVESLGKGELRRLERLHDPEQARQAFRHLRDVGFSNVNVDLMHGLEGQDLIHWKETLTEVIAWNPEHVSAYGLTIEEKTRYAKEQRLGKLFLPPEEIQAELLMESARVLAEAGYRRYEISNFARPGFESRHNLIYWTGGEYWGVGVAAHSFQKRNGTFTRWWNPRDLRSYVRALLAASDLPRESETITPQVHWGERLMTGLRLIRGVSLAELEAEIGVPIPKTTADGIRRFSGTGHLRTEEGHLTLSSAGILISNEIFRGLLS
ncbi:MAG: radical SAM family heme chaperone HemW [Pseudomonadota bacterium]